MSAIKLCKYCGAECERGQTHNCLNVQTEDQNSPKLNTLKRQFLRVKRANGRTYFYERKVGIDWDADPDLWGWYAPTTDYKNGYCIICKQVFQPRKASLIKHGRRYHQNLIDQKTHSIADAVGKNMDHEVVEEDEERFVDQLIEEESTEEVLCEQLEEEEEAIHKAIQSDLDRELQDECVSTPEMSMSVAENDNSSEAILPNSEIPQESEEQYLNDAWAELRTAQEKLDLERNQLKAEREEFVRTKLEFQKQEKIFYGLLQHLNIDLTK